MHPFFTLPSSRFSTDSSGLASVCALDSLSVFDATGQDAIAFLQGQLTNDIVSPGLGQSRLAGYCTAQGRLLATMVLGQAPEADQVPVIRGFMRADILAPVLKRLSMFVLRSKVTLRPDSAKVAGVTATALNRAALIEQLGHPLPEAAWETIHVCTGTWIAAPSLSGETVSAASLSRWWWIAGPEHVDAVEKLNLNLARKHAERWACLDIRSGLPWIEARTQDMFIPQTLNLELIGGVSFTKGCYPGQEIVARSHYRGTVKRRMALGRVLLTGDDALIPGSDIFDASQADQPCGRLINVGVQRGLDEAEQWILFETTFEAFDRQQLRAAAVNGPVIETVALPYLTR